MEFKLNFRSISINQHTASVGLGCNVFGRGVFQYLNTTSAAATPNHPHALIFYYNWTHWALIVDKTLPPPFVEPKWSLSFQNSSPLQQSWASWIQFRLYFLKAHINMNTLQSLLCFQSCFNLRYFYSNFGQLFHVLQVSCICVPSMIIQYWR